MTEHKRKMSEDEAIYCLKAESERYPHLCEECQLYGQTGCDHCYDDANDVAIKALEEIQQYRALGTVEELRVARDKQVEEFCEWKTEKDLFIQNPHTKRKFSNEPSMKNVYCNTCGKKIKVV